MTIRENLSNEFKFDEEQDEKITSCFSKIDVLFLYESEISVRKGIRKATNSLLTWATFFLKDPLKVIIFFFESRHLNMCGSILSFPTVNSDKNCSISVK